VVPVSRKYAFVLEPSEHAELSASSADRWATCTASPALARGLPNHTTAYAAQGTAGHHISALVLRSMQAGKAFDPRATFLGKYALVEGHEIHLNDELIEAVEDYIADCAADTQPGDTVFVEQSFHEALQRLHPKFGGSSDRVRWRPSTRQLQVTDLKMGAGIPVDVDDNRQLKYYALGALLTNPQFNAEDVELRIAQPRCEHEAGRFRSYHFKAMELVEFAADLVDAALETEDFTRAKLVPSKKACKWCPAAAAKKCPALEKETHALVAADFSVIDPAKYSKEQIAEFLAKAPLVEQHISAIREFAYQESLKGEKFPGWKIVEKRARRKWQDESFVANALKDTPGAFTTPELRSPAQVEKLLGKKKFKVLEGHIVKESSGYTLAADDDPRPPATVALLTDFEATPPE
jgi:hypothetical protein